MPVSRSSRENFLGEQTGRPRSVPGAPESRHLSYVSVLCPPGTPLGPHRPLSDLISPCATGRPGPRSPVTVKTGCRMMSTYKAACHPGWYQPTLSPDPPAKVQARWEEAGVVNRTQELGWSPLGGLCGGEAAASAQPTPQCRPTPDRS